MARGKNSPALFEVIRNAQQKQREQFERDRQRQEQLAVAEGQGVSPAAQLLRSPLYWFKGKHAHAAAAGLTAQVMREVPVASPVDSSRQAEPTVTPTPAPPAAAEPVTRVAPIAPQPVVYALPVPPTFQLHSPAAEAARQVREEIAAQEAPAAEPLFASSLPAYDDYGPAFDAHAGDDASAPSAGQIRLQFNYTTAAIAGFAVVVAFVVVFVVATAGRRVANRAVAAATPVRHDVLNVNPTPAGNTADVAETTDRASVGGAAEALALDTPGKPIPVPTNVKRIVGYQYLVLMSFPTEDPAKDMVKFLADNGVPASAERALPGYAKSWTSVITARGFDHTKNNPAFDAYRTALANLKQKYQPNSKFSGTFKIDLYTWRTAR